MRKLSLTLVCLLVSIASLQAAPLTGVLEVGGGSNDVNITNTSPLTGTIGFHPGSAVLPAANGTSGTFLIAVGNAVVFSGQGNPPTLLDFNALTAAGVQPFLTTDGITFTLMTEATNLSSIGGGNSTFDIS